MSKPAFVPSGKPLLPQPYAFEEVIAQRKKLKTVARLASSLCLVVVFGAVIWLVVASAWNASDAVPLLVAGALMLTLMFLASGLHSWRLALESKWAAESNLDRMARLHLLYDVSENVRLFTHEVLRQDRVICVGEVSALLQAYGQHVDYDIAQRFELRLVDDQRRHAAAVHAAMAHLPTRAELANRAKS